MDFASLPVSEGLVALVSIVGTLVGTRLLDRSKDKKVERERRLERVRAIMTSLSDLEDDLHSLETEFEAVDNELPRIARMFASIIQDKIDLDEAKILKWEGEFLVALEAIKTLDVGMYMRLLGEKRDFRGFFKMILLPYLSQRQEQAEGHPELISIAIREFLRELRETILALAKELPSKERQEVIVHLGPIQEPPKSEDEQQLEILELIASAIPIPMEKPITIEDLKWLNNQSENPALGVLLDRFADFLPLLPGLFERVLFGNLDSLGKSLVNLDEGALRSWFSIDKEKEDEIEHLFESFWFTDEEQETFVGNKEIGRLIVGIFKRVGFELSFKDRRYLVAVQNGWMNLNQLIAYFRDNRIPVLAYNVNHTVPVLPEGYSKVFGSSDAYHLYLELKARLEGYSERIFYHPMTEAEIAACETGIGYPLPPYFRDFLAVFGVKQDILPWLLWADGAFFIAGNPLPEADKGKFFTIGRMTEHGLFFIHFSDPTDDMVYHLEFAGTKRLEPIGRFPELVEKAVNEAIANYDSRRLNAEKIRKSDFHFYSEDYDAIVTPLLEYLQADELPDFEFSELVQDVAIWKTTLKFEQKAIVLQRHESFDDKQYPKYYLTLTEPITDLKAESFVEFIRNCYKELEIKSEFLEFNFRKIS